MLSHRRWTCVFTVACFAAAVAASPSNRPASSVSKSADKNSSPTASAHAARPAAVAPAVVANTSEGNSPDALASNLPVRRVVLYKSGVGYFEHQGRVQGDQSVGIDFTSGQLNDVLQSLTVLDLNGGRITGVDYNSDAPLSQRLSTLSLPLGDNTNIENFYGALRGVRLEMHEGTTVTSGRLLSVEQKTRVSGGNTLEVDVATLVSDTGEVRSIELSPAVTVQVADRDASKEVSRYLSLIASVRQEQLRRMTIATAGTGDRNLYVSYISEVPVWKTTYRIVLPSKSADQPLLQGWAIVDNTVGEDWNNVELSLVAGAPQSFIQPLSQPYYTRRPVIGLPEMAQIAPQTHEGAMTNGNTALSGVITDPTGAVISNASITLKNSLGQNAGSVLTDGSGRYQFSDLPAGTYTLSANVPGFQTGNVTGLNVTGGVALNQNLTMQVGSVASEVTVTASASHVETDSAVRGRNYLGSGNELGRLSVSPGVMPRLGSGVGGGTGMMANPAQIDSVRQQMQAVANGSDLGDLFEYKLKDRVTIRKNESALVPIVQAKVDAEKVSLWNSSFNSTRPLRALWLTNSSPLTLDGGSFSVLEDETFAGEGITDSIRPGEKRIISYATDLGVRVDKTSFDSAERVTHVYISHGVMRQVSEQRETTTYTIRNDDTTSRTMLIEHPVRPGWNLNPSDAKPDEKTSSVYRFRVSVGAKGTATFTVREASPLQTTYQISDINNDQVALFLRQKSINPVVEAELRKILAQKDRVDGFNNEVSKRDDERTQIFDDQQRIRENMKALKGTPEERALTQRYTQQLNDEETRLDTLKHEMDAFQAKADEAQGQLDKMIEQLSMDVEI